MGCLDEKGGRRDEEGWALKGCFVLQLGMVCVPVPKKAPKHLEEERLRFRPQRWAKIKTGASLGPHHFSLQLRVAS